MTFCHNDFFLAASFMCSFKKLSPLSCSFKKLSPVSCSFSKKMSHLSVVVVKPFVILQQKKHDYKWWFWQVAKKLFFELQNVETLAILLFLADFLKLFFFPPTFSQKCNFESTFYVVFFFVFSKFTALERILSNSNETDNGFTENFRNYLKLFATVIVSLKLAAKKK